MTVLFIWNRKGMMSLGLDSGEMVTVIADGPDEEVAVEDIAKYLCSGKSN